MGGGFNPQQLTTLQKSHERNANVLAQPAALATTSHRWPRHWDKRRTNKPPRRYPQGWETGGLENVYGPPERAPGFCRRMAGNAEGGPGRAAA